MAKRKYFIFLLLIVIIPKSLFAQIEPTLNLKIDSRIDEKSIWKGGDDFSSEFNIQNLKIELNGEITNRLSYRFRARVANISSEFNAVDYAYLTYKANDKFSVIVGKQFTIMGTFEHNLSSIKRYLSSVFTPDAPIYQTGVRFIYSPNKAHNFNFQIVSGNKNVYKILDYKSSFQYLFLWNGTITSWWKTKVGYNIVNRSSSEWLDAVTIGNKFTLNKTSLEIDFANWYRYTNMESGETKNRDIAVVLNLSRSLDNNERWWLALKGIYDQRDIVSGAIHNSDNRLNLYKKYTAAFHLEYYPIKGEDINIHLAYGRSHWDYSSFKRNDNTIIFGVTCIFGVKIIKKKSEE